jgi:hypothetical protein
MGGTKGIDLQRTARGEKGVSVSLICIFALLLTE